MLRWPRAGAYVLSGILLFQLAWLISIPAFGGIDEFDHAYRAASVAQGYWAPPLKPLRNGPGDLIPVPSSLVRAAENRCSILPYTKFGNCHAVAPVARRGDVLIASTAARYNPIYPWLVGTASRPFSGSAALYVMRATTVLLCDVFLLSSWALVTRPPSGRWKRGAALTTITPVFLYATTNAAPNGVEMCAGLLMWCAGLSLGKADERRGAIDLWLFCLATTTVLTVHSTGPLWAACIVATLAMWPGTLARLSATWRRHRQQAAASATIVVLVAVADAVWSLSRSTNLNWTSDLKVPPLSATTLLETFPLWVFQTIGAIPFRNDYVPPVVFATSLVMLGTLFVIALKFAPWRQRGALLAIALVFFAVPTVLTILSYQSLGLAWQGRYALPYACGLPILCGWNLDAAPIRAAVTVVFEKVATLGFCLTQAISIWSVTTNQNEHWPASNSLQAPPIVLQLELLASATILISLGMWRYTYCDRQESAERPEYLEKAAYS